MPLTKEEIQILLDNNFEIVCESPLEFERYAQFSGGVHKLYTEEEQRAEIEAIKVSEDFRKFLIEKESKSKEKDIKELKKFVKDLLVTGITEETLLEFYMVSCWFGKKRGNEITSHDLKRWFKEVFDEVEPP
jgi:CRISPR/Cas system endoribonuclease Cas6 (RAMP superfamily)